MEISITKTTTPKQKPLDQSKLGFGNYYTDHMFIMNYDDGEGWHDPRIVPYAPIPLDPAAMCLHYGQEVFEGMKAYKTEDGGIQLFRPEKNMARLNVSNERLCIPQIDEELGLEAVKKLVETDTKGNAVSDYGKMDEEAMQQTLDLAKQYILLDDSSAAQKLQTLTLDDIRDTSFWESAMTKDFGTPEKSDVSVQLKWLPQCQFMGYYVAKAKGYYDEVGLNVNIVSGGGDIGETTAVNNGTVDFGVTWVSNLISANAGGMDLLEVAQVYQRSGLVLVYKK